MRLWNFGLGKKNLHLKSNKGEHHEYPADRRLNSLIDRRF